jgi:predicted ATPase
LELEKERGPFTTLPGRIIIRVVSFEFLSRLKKNLARAGSGNRLAPVRVTDNAPKPEIAVGSVIAQRYRLDAELGRGGMGVVFRAHDLQLDRAVALKIIYLDAASRSREQFLREAQITAQLAHPHIVALYETGFVNPAAAQPIPFLVMEFIGDKNLGDMRALTFAQIVDLAQQTCDALEYAHARGLVHRDLKPENVLIERQGFQYVAKLADFGLATARGAPVQKGDGAEGTVYYLAPEVIAGKPADVGADLYALGVMLYEMVTGRVPFSNFDAETIFVQHLRESAAPPSQSRPDVPPALESIILRLLAKDPKDRFESADQVCRALEQLAAAPAPGAVRTNLPQPTTTFVGRADEVMQVTHLLESQRLVTLAGAEGVGKTRLALAVAERLMDQFPDGVWLVNLEPWNDPAMVPQIVASVLDIHEESPRALVVTLTERLRERNLLLLFDHCQHLGGACAQIAKTILDTCPAVRILATGSTPLDVSGEHVFSVTPLSASDAEQLLLDRLAAAMPYSQFIGDRKASLKHVCASLNALPLAIEIFAAHVVSFVHASLKRKRSCGECPPEDLTLEPLDELLERNIAGVEKQLALAGDLPTDEQRLYAVLDWVQQSLDPPTRALFHRLSVFAGGCTLQAIESFAGLGNLDAAVSVDRLVEEALVNTSPARDGSVRYTMPAPVRRLAQSQLQAAGEEQAARSHHRDGYMLLAIQAEPNLHGSEQSIWSTRLETEYANLLAAFDWTIAQPEQTAQAIRFANALWPFWNERGYWRDSRARLTRILALPHTPAQAAARAFAVIGAGYLALRDEDYSKAHELLEQGLATARKFKDQRAMAYALGGLASVAQARHDDAQAQSLWHSSREHFRSAGNTWESANALLNLGRTTLSAGDVHSARDLFSASLNGFREIGDVRGIAHSLGGLGLVAYRLGQYSAAFNLFAESLPIWRGLHDQVGLAYLLLYSGYAALRQDQPDQARESFSEALIMLRESRARRPIADTLYGIAGALALQRQPERAAQLVGAADALSQSPSTIAGSTSLLDREWIVSRIRLEPTAFQAASAVGSALGMEQSIARALER